jgi:MFS family permease
VRSILTLGAVGLPVFVGALDLTVVSAVLPAVIAGSDVPLQKGLAEGSWAVSGYFASYLFGVLTMGRLSDLLGRRATFLSSLGVFVIGSVWSAAARDLGEGVFATTERLLTGTAGDPGLATLHALVLGRVIQGFGAGAQLPIAFAVISERYPTDQRTQLVGLIAGVDTAGWLLGHVYGGLAVQVVPWPFLFWANVPLSLVAAGLVYFTLPGDIPRAERGALDWWGVGLLAIAVIATTLAIGSAEVPSTTALTRPVGTPLAVALLVPIAVVALAAFVAVELHATSPLVELRALAGRLGSVTSVANLLLGFAVMTCLVSVPLLVNATSGRPSQENALASGEILALFTIPLGLAAFPGGALARRFGLQTMAAIGLGVAFCGFLLASGWRAETAQAAAVAFIGFADVGRAGSAWGPLVGLVVAGVGLGLATAPIASALLHDATAARYGATAALVVALRLIGMTVAASALVSFGLRRSSDLLRAVLLQSATAPGELGEIVGYVATQVSDEMLLAGAAACAIAGTVSLIVAAAPSDKPSAAGGP